jgi:sRNA-binding carbon storage regulator CsrA
MYVEKGQRKELKDTIRVNGLNLNELKIEDSYKYLGMDEDISYRGEINKERAKKEYFRRVKKIWRSELYSKNKVIAHNIFATPIFTLTFGILDWTKNEILQIDVQTRKILTFTGNFHRNSSVDRLYMLRTDGGRGLNSIYDIFVARMIALNRHLEEASERNQYLRLVLQHEENSLIRVANEFTKAIGITGNQVKISVEAKNAIKKQRKEAYEEKSQHGYVHRQQEKSEGYNKKLTNMWLSNPNMISHTEGYIVAIQEQEIYTRALKAKREHADDHSYNKMCRFCNEKIEDIFHLLCSCNFLSASMYLPLRHDEVAREAYNAIIKHHFPDLRYTLPQSVWKYGHLEIWWDTHISTTPRVKHNKPDMVIWNYLSMTCSVVDICVPLDLNVHVQEKTKRDTYGPLIVGLLRHYPKFKFDVVPLVIGATGLVTDSLTMNLKKLIERDGEVEQAIGRMQRKALVGSMRVLKSALSMRSI